MAVNLLAALPDGAKIKSPLRSDTGGGELKFDQNPRGVRVTATTAAAAWPRWKAIAWTEEFIDGGD